MRDWPLLAAACDAPGSARDCRVPSRFAAWIQSRSMADAIALEFSDRRSALEVADAPDPGAS